MTHEPVALTAGVIVALAFLAFAAYTVARLSRTAPTRMNTTIVSLTILLGALPAILITLYGA